MKNLVLLIGLCACCSNAQSQFIRGPIANYSVGVQNGLYVRETIPTKKVIPYEYVREADVMWSKRVWSVIDLREKFNQPLYYPMDDIQDGTWNRNASIWSLWTIIRHHVMMGDLTVYSPFNPNWEDWKDGDAFKYPVFSDLPGGNFYTDSLFQEQLFLYFGTEVIDPFANACESILYPGEDSTIILLDGSTVTVYPPNDTAWFLSQDIVQYKIKEDWFFDRERSVMDRRIIGIAPVIYQRDVNGDITGTRELFWLYFPECRYVFQNYFLKNRHNDAQLMSVDDLFWKRMFQSYIVKESNTYDRGIDSYKAGVDALLESNRIMEQIANYEHDLWNF